MEEGCDHGDQLPDLICHPHLTGSDSRQWSSSGGSGSSSSGCCWSSWSSSSLSVHVAPQVSDEFLLRFPYFGEKKSRGEERDEKSKKNRKLHGVEIFPIFSEVQNIQPYQLIYISSSCLGG